MGGRCASALALLAAVVSGAGVPLWARPSQQNSPAVSADAEAGTRGLTVNNQTNLQINTLPFTGFGPGINCPTPSLTAGLFGVQGSGRASAGSGGDPQSSTSLGGLLRLNLPIGATDARICADLGRARIKLLEGQTETLRSQIGQLRGEIGLQIASRCIEALRQARLSDSFAVLCQGVGLQATNPTPAPRLSADLILQRFDP